MTEAAVPRPPGDRRLLLSWQLLTLVTATAYTLASLRSPHLRVALHAGDARAILEVAGVFLVLFSALMMAIPDDDQIRPARNAFISALAVIAVTNGLFGVSATVAWQRLTVDEGLAFYPWVAARYEAGLLFILAGIERPRLSLPRYLWASLTVLVLADGLLLLGAERLPALVQLRNAGGSPEITILATAPHAVLQAVPGALFLLGGWLAGRTYLRSGAPVFLLLSLALIAQAFTQVHEIVQPAFLGPVVTTADVFRSASFVLLFLGALLQVRRLYQERSDTVRAQQADLYAQDVLAEELMRFLVQEQDFRAIVSHELATPVATIRAFAHVLGGAVTPSGPARHRHALEGILAETRRLTELIARIDELRDLELAEFRCDLRPVAIRPLLEEAASFARGLPGDHPTTVDSDHVRVSADPVRLGQAIRNVLTNAARYAPSSTPVAIQGREVSGGRFWIAISDRGPGVPLEEREVVLRRYARGTTGRRTPGTGLGLYVTSRIVEAHNGRMWIEDAGGAPGTGTRVVIELPLADRVLA
ncbi:MAG TPA: ATP-binding protein [Nitriliruptorales bacterium]|nr:ATP-binding protein [Nitriliruptorales bacterium]